VIFGHNGRALRALASTGVNDRLLELYQGVAVHANADLEHTAALELLALVMAADHNLDELEIEAIKEISDDWRDGDFTFDKYLGAAVERAKTAIDDDEVVELIDDIDARISSRVLRRALFSAAREVAGIDDDVSPEEGTILAEIAVRFS
jgi:uncharacterized tellurite resistance protein B-like protein